MVFTIAFYFYISTYDTCLYWLGNRDTKISVAEYLKKNFGYTLIEAREIVHKLLANEEVELLISDQADMLTIFEDLTKFGIKCNIK